MRLIRRCLRYIKGVTTKRREAASHLLVFMVSDEQRSSKPYAIPIRALPYKSITDDMVRRLRDEIHVRDAMHELGMLAVGKKLCFHRTDFHLLASLLRVLTGHGKPGKSWNLRISFPGP